MSTRENDKRAFLLATRRNMMKLVAALPLAAVPFVSALARPTPSAMEGPFYPTPGMRFSDADNDLVKIADAVKSAGGEVIKLKGRVLNRDGQPIAGARVEIWQCDVNGRYLHTEDHARGRPDRDGAFQGFGHFITGEDGAYWFRTIKPVPYPGRAPHIHVKVIHGGRELTTQFYIDGHDLNAPDFLFRQMSEEDQRVVSMAFADDGEVPEATVDVVL